MATTEKRHATPPLPAPFATDRECWFWAGWEPDRYYRRIGARQTPFFGNGEWVPAWRQSLESTETLEAVRHAGGTVVMTRFYKGFGLATERRDWTTLRDFVERAHAAGVKVLGYLQGQSLFGEVLFNDYPEAVNWVARRRDGNPDTWGGAYNRFAPCLGHPGYLAMMEAIVTEGIATIGLDGLHMDNNYYKHCYCPGCKERFREWLAARGDLEARTGIERPAFIEPPPLHADVEFNPDPLSLLWIEFGVQQRLQFMQAIRRRVKEENPLAVLTGNPAFMRSFASRITHAFDPALEAEACDGVCIENGNRPRFSSSGLLHTQADKLLIAEASRLKSWLTGWAPGKEEGYGIPTNPQALWAGMAEEFSFHRAALGNNWALRPAADGPALLLERQPEAWQEFQRATTFFQTLDERLGPQRSQWGEVALYIDTETLCITPSSDAFLAQAVIQELLLQRIPFRLLLQQQPVPEEVHTILIAGQRALREQEVERLALAMAARRGELWLLGPCGTHDEWAICRNISYCHRLANLRGVRSFPAITTLREAGPATQYFRGTSPSLSPEGKAAMAAIITPLRERLRFCIDAPAGVLLNVETDAEGRYLLHLRDLREEANGLAEGAVRLLSLSCSTPAIGYAPGWVPGQTLAVDSKGHLSLPAFAHYACVVASSLTT